ncbi:MAG TPA: DUF1275 family protein [Rhizomicrobium sp.]|nr:DUF1275 family protein [Rhizomicrobium sp.]
MVTEPQHSPSLSLLLSLNAGYTDTIGFLALHGLFTAHVTGNFVTLGASLALGLSGLIAKLLALPVFCIAVMVTRVFALRLAAMNRPGLRIMLAIKVLLLCVGAGMALRFGPFPNGDSIAAIATGMPLVAAMAVQNATHRIYLAQLPPTTIMTGTTTQIMIDVADLLQGLAPEASVAAAARLRRMSTTVITFAAGCGAAALLYTTVGIGCFAVLPVLGVWMLLSDLD